MILVNLINKNSHFSYPRVSGGDPKMGTDIELIKKLSPRERG